MLGSALFAARLLHPKRGVLSNFITTNPQGWTNRLYPLWYPAIIAIPLALAALSLLGDVYTAGISIAFPQRDVHLSAAEPLDVRPHRTQSAHSEPTNTNRTISPIDML